MNYDANGNMISETSALGSGQTLGIMKPDDECDSKRVVRYLYDALVRRASRLDKGVGGTGKYTC